MWGATYEYLRLYLVPEFQFTHPVWGATVWSTSETLRTYVSIHAPRVGCDVSVFFVLAVSMCFNSRTPCGVRPDTGGAGSAEQKFQFTHPVWGATHKDKVGSPLRTFQFTHPVWGAT